MCVFFYSINSLVGHFNSRLFTLHFSTLGEYVFCRWPMALVCWTYGKTVARTLSLLPNICPTHICMCMCLWWWWRQSQRTERRLWYRQRESPLSLSSHNSICGLKCWKPFYRCGLEPEIGPIKFNHYQIRWLTSQCDSAELCLECCCTWYTMLDELTTTIVERLRAKSVLHGEWLPMLP